MQAAQLEIFECGERIAVVGTPLFVHAVTSLIGMHSVVGTTGFLAHLPLLVARTRPDTVLLQWNEPLVEALEASVRRVSSVDSDVRFVALAPGDRLGDVRARLRGVDVAVCRTECEPDELIAALHAPTTPSPRPPEVVAARPLLTRRELEVLEGAARGMTNRAIGKQMGISENTVKNHLRHVHRKLRAQSRTEAIMRAVHYGLLRLPALPVSAPAAESPVVAPSAPTSA